MDNRTRDTGHGLLGRWRGGFNRASLAEKQLVSLRLAVSGGLFLALLIPFLQASASPSPSTALILSGLYLLFSLSLLAALTLPSATQPLRLNMALIGDITMPCAGLFLAAELAVPLLLAGLWLVLSYGLRFGPSFMYRASLLSAAGFTLAMLFNPYWSEHLLVGGTLLIAILAAPITVVPQLIRWQPTRMDRPPSSKGPADSGLALRQESTVSLWGIMGMADRLLHSPLNLEQKELTQGIHRMAQHLESRTEHAASITHGNNADPASTETAINLRQLIDGVLQTLQCGIQQKSLAFSIQVAADVPFRIAGNALPLRLLLCNLIGDAIYSLEAGSKISLDIRHTASKDAFYPQSLLRFEFKAGGLKPLRQGHRSTSAANSTYLTPITRQLTHQLNGSLGIETRSDSGPVLWLDLPVASPQEQPSESNHAALKKMRVLLITPDPALGRQLEGYHCSWQVKQTICQTSLQACAELITATKQNHPYDAALIDVRHLDMEPTQFAHLVRQEEAICKLTPIALYPADHPSSGAALHEAGFAAALQLPIDKTLLFNALHNSQLNPDDSHKITRLIDRYGQSKHATSTLDILVAAADKSNRMHVRKILERAGHRVYLVENGEQALNALDTHRFDLAILEMQLPVMSGIEAVKLYRFTHLHDNWMPFVMLVAEGNPAAIQQCRRADVDRCLVGPVKPQELLEHIKHIDMEKISGQRQSVQPNKPTANSPPCLEANHLDRAILGQSTLSELEKLGTGRDFVSNLINNFLQDSDYQLAQMESAFHLRQYQSYIDLAHTFKDSAGNLGALAIYNLSVTATRLSEDEFVSEGGRLVTAIRKAFELTRRALMNYLARQDDSISQH